MFDAKEAEPAKAVSPEALAELQLGVGNDPQSADVPEGDLLAEIAKLREQVAQLAAELAALEGRPAEAA